MVLSNMGKVWEDIPWLAKVLGGSVLVGGLVFALRHRCRNTKTRKEYPKDTVVFHHPMRGPNNPSLSPFAVKLEMYFKMAKIPYEAVVSLEASSKGKFPWIEYNNEAVADSDICIKFLNKERGVNLNSHLTPEQEGVGRAFQKMLEENTYWIMVLDRWFFDETNGLVQYCQFPWYVTRHFKKTLYNQAYNQGIARHSKEEILQILRLDLSALSKYLGSKKFLFGHQACQYDCAVFGLLSSCLWEGFGGYVPKIMKEYPNLCKYCENMRNEFWPDWDECSAEGMKRKQQ